MIYCMADIHGKLNWLEQMLKQIAFSPADHLYLLGDVIDRGPDGVEILERVMATPNMTMLLGNHEYMCLIALGRLEGRSSIEHWYRNGGSVTHEKLEKGRTPEEREMILQFLESLPDFLELEVGGQVFQLVHGMPADNRYDRVWKRPVADTPNPLTDRTTIIGHTPTCDLNQPFTIWHGPGGGLVDIDCGCGEDEILGKLGCLRLDDMAEFYVSNAPDLDQAIEQNVLDDVECDKDVGTILKP